MGQDWKLDKAVSPRLIQAMFCALDAKIANAMSAPCLSQWITACALMAFLYVISC
jgi:hypothetical protein